MGRQWRLLGPPLRPSPPDLRLARQAIASLRSSKPQGDIDALVLGVTPELIQLEWPPQSTLIAVDRNPDMIEAVFPKAVVPSTFRATIADWLALPAPAQSIDIVLGDGCLTLLDFPSEYEALGREVRRVLRPGGSFCLRVFASPETSESLERVRASLDRSEIPSFHVLKWRLAMCVQTSPSQGVKLDDIWRAFRDIAPDPQALCDRLGWDPAVTGTIESYRGSATRYTFPRLSEIQDIMGRFFEGTNRLTPSYALGERCPSLAWMRSR